MTARIVNRTTGQITPLQVVWHEEDGPECQYCDRPLPERIPLDDWICDDCIERLALRDFFGRSQEAQDRAVLRGMG